MSRGEDTEHTLYQTVRNSEFYRQKQEAVVRRLQGQLSEVKRQNSVKIKEQVTELTKQEQELEQRLIREQAMLAKVSVITSG